MKPILLRRKSYIQPFEHRLAIREVEALAPGARIKPSESDADVFYLHGGGAIKRLAEHLAYWEVAGHDSGDFTRQALRESTVNVVRNGISLDELHRKVPVGSTPPIVNRRCLRYASHGIHEYRGKYFPQLVRALLNLSDCEPGAWIGDPMAGSGTTLVEALLSGFNAVGLDMNPLSVLIGNTKSDSLFISPKRLEMEYLRLRDTLLKDASPRGLYESEPLEFLEPDDRRYIEAWFSPRIISEISFIRTKILEIQDIRIRNLFIISLSNILRRVSWQKEDDLRVRRDARVDVEIDAFREFLEDLGRTVRFVLAFLLQEGRKPKGRFTYFEGDAKRCDSLFAQSVKSLDCIITSPPYATALPYLDTDRLSIIFLNLLSRKDHRRRDLCMIGNREISDKLRREFLIQYGEKKSLLPATVSDLIDEVEERNRSADVGFRRKNLGALLAKYFFDMREVLMSARNSLKAEGMAHFVVGSNFTIAGGERVTINTPKLLAALGESVGFKVSSMTEMDMLVPRDIHRKNSIATESIIHFKNG